MTTEQDLFDDRLEDAAVATVMGLGGYKRVGPYVYPEVDPEAAANRLRDALNPDRREHLSPERMVRLLEAGRERGVHTLMVWLARHAGYSDPQPITPEDERAELARQMERTVAQLARLTERLEVLQVPTDKLRRAA